MIEDKDTPINHVVKSTPEENHYYNNDTEDYLLKVYEGEIAEVEFFTPNTPPQELNIILKMKI